MVDVEDEREGGDQDEVGWAAEEVKVVGSVVVVKVVVIAVRVVAVVSAVVAEKSYNIVFILFIKIYCD